MVQFTDIRTWVYRFNKLRLPKIVVFGKTSIITLTSCISFVGWLVRFAHIIDETYVLHINIWHRHLWKTLIVERNTIIDNLIARYVESHTRSLYRHLFCGQTLCEDFGHHYGHSCLF